MQERQGHQTTVSARGYLPYPLSPPYYVNRTEEYQKRVFDYARNYFSPAEMSDLMRLEIFFVPQEAERIKRNLRRKGDFDPRTRDHPAATRGGFTNRFDRFAAAAARNPSFGTATAPAMINGDLAAFQQGDAAYVNQVTDATQAGLNDKAHQYQERSFLRRVENFIASMFVFDCAHGLLAHLHEEVISLTSHGTQADDELLRQIIRNVRGYTFKRLLKANTDPFTDENDDHEELEMDPNGPDVKVRDDPKNPNNTSIYKPAKFCAGKKDPMRDWSLNDLTQPFSSTELEQLQKEGWIKRHNLFWAPTRGSSSLGAKMDISAFAIGPTDTVDASRAMGIYPVTFLTNTSIADDACAARLIEHCSAETMDPQFFSWGMRRQVFMPLEVDVADIYRFQDLQAYDELHEALNSFSNGMFAGVSIQGMWADYLRPRLSQVLTQIPMNQLKPFANIIKHIEMPAVPGEMRHTAGQAEIIRLYNKADDILAKVDQWFQFSGDFSSIPYEKYRKGEDSEAILGNTAIARGWGQRALGISGCGQGYTGVGYTTDPSNPEARLAQPLRAADGTYLLNNPQMNNMTCAPQIPNPHVPLMTHAQVAPQVHTTRRSNVLAGYDARRRKRKSRR